MTIIQQGPIGDVGSEKLEFVGGALVITADAKVLGSVVSAGVVMKVDSNALIDAICAAIPGTVDDVLGGVLKTALKALG